VNPHIADMKQSQAPQSLLIPSWNPSWSETRWDVSFNARLENLRLDLLRTCPLDARMHMAIDETLLYRVADGRRAPLLWFWEWKERAIILGSYQSVVNEIDAEAAHAEGFTFARRVSGGGAMLVEPGRTITFSLIVPESLVDGLSFVQSFAFLDQWCVRVLRALGVPAVYRPINDIATPEGKLAGAAQCRRKRAVLHHVTMAQSFDNDLMLRVMRLRRPVLNEKGIPSAVKMVSPLSAFVPLSQDEAKHALMDAASRIFTLRATELTEDERTEAQERLRDKFDAREWLYRVA
jgi:lipoate---protein ligase